MKKIGALVIVFSMLFTITIAPIFAANETLDASYSVSKTETFYSGNDGTVAITITCTSLYPYVSSQSFDDYLNRDILTINQEYIYRIRVWNDTNDTYRFDRGSINFTATRNDFSSDIYNGGYISKISPTGYSVGTLYGNLLSSFNVNTVGTITANINEIYNYSNNLTLPPHTSIYALFTVIDTFSCDCTYSDNNFISTYFSKFDRPVLAVNISAPTSVTLNNDAYLYNANVNSYYTAETVQDMYDELISLRTQINTLNSRVNTINNNVQIITDAYTDNFSNVTDTQDNIDTVTSTESQLHSAEVNFYQQNEQALQNVGISNFSFSSDQSSGLGSVITDFTTLWNNIGPLQIIFTFTLSMSLATFLLRHKPVTGAIKKNESRR